MNTKLRDILVKFVEEIEKVFIGASEMLENFEYVNRSVVGEKGHRKPHLKLFSIMCTVSSKVRVRMTSEDVKTSETAVSMIVNLGKKAKIASELVKAPSRHALLSIYKFLVAGGNELCHFDGCLVVEVKNERGCYRDSNFTKDRGKGKAEPSSSPPLVYFVAHEQCLRGQPMPEINICATCGQQPTNFKLCKVWIRNGETYLRVEIGMAKKFMGSGIREYLTQRARSGRFLDGRLKKTNLLSWILVFFAINPFPYQRSLRVQTILVSPKEESPPEKWSCRQARRRWKERIRVENEDATTGCGIPIDKSGERHGQTDKFKKFALDEGIFDDEKIGDELFECIASSRLINHLHLLYWHLKQAQDSSNFLKVSLREEQGLAIANEARGALGKCLGCLPLWPALDIIDGEESRTNKNIYKNLSFIKALRVASVVRTNLGMWGCHRRWKMVHRRRKRGVKGVEDGKWYVGEVRVAQRHDNR
ncbi:hypothetical protein LguiB_026530 [Lonicera macranthoides]